MPAHTGPITFTQFCGGAPCARAVFPPVLVSRLQEVIDAWFRAYPHTPEQLSIAAEGDARLVNWEAEQQLARAEKAKTRK